MSTQSTRFRDTCHELGKRQHGVVARFQLLDAGIPGETIDYGVRSRFLFKAIRGVFSVGRPEISIFGMWMACVLASGKGAALAGRTAAIAWGFRDRPQSPVCVIRPNSNGYQARANLKAHGHNSRIQLKTQRCRWFTDEHLTRFQGIPILRVEPLLLQLAGQLDGEDFQYAFWEADRIKGLNDRQLEACVDISRRLSGGPAFRQAVDCRLPHIEDARSLLEVLVSDLCRREPIPAPVINRTEQGHLIDFRWVDRRVAVEVDGYEYHRGHGSFERDAELDNDLRAVGWIVLRFTYRMVKYRPDYVRDTILKALGI